MSDHYWQDPNVNLYYNTSQDCSIDEKGAKKYNKKATTKFNYVTELQEDLIATGYPPGIADGVFGSKTRRALRRFQRRAKNSRYRTKTGAVPADVATNTYNGKIDGICDGSTAKELRFWIDKQLKAPLGRFKLTPITGGTLRSDVANIWTMLTQKIKNEGGTIESPYGDTTRSVTFRKSTGGNSLFSLHYTGRAIDLNQGLAGGKGQRYYVIKEPTGNDTYWRIYCKTDKQDSSQGKKLTKAEKIKYYSFWAKKEIDLPEAYYMDLTEKLKSAGFNRIRAHANWETNPKGAEWWHFHYDKQLQETFQDEMELIGIDEANLRRNGWDTEAKLDRKPG